MTEAEWLACTIRGDMSVFLRERWETSLSNYGEEETKEERFYRRKVTLFMAGCCRRIREWLVDPRAVETVELVAEGLDHDSDEVQKIITEVGAAATGEYTPESEAANAAYLALDPMDGLFEDADTVADHAISAVNIAADLQGRKADSRAEEIFHANLWRELLGNPFRPYQAPATWPSAVVELAQSLYDGNDNRLILADALEEAGHQDLAEHFRNEEWHPKGCWVVDMILGKE